MRAAIFAVVGFVVACNDSQSGNKPVGGAVDSEAAIQRYVRRVTLDLSGKTPSDGELAAGTLQLQQQQNSPTARGAFVDGLLGQSTYPTEWVNELENGIFGGMTLDQQYAFLCGIVRSMAQACMSCSATDACSCSCPALTPIYAEREVLRSSATDLGSGTASSTIERRYAMAVGYYAFSGSPEGRVSSLFDDFLARTAELDEIENGRAMVVGSIIPGAPSGLMFHREGSSYADLIDIVFTSEVYREAIVRRVFERYLSREPSAAELSYFVTTLDAKTPDSHGLVRAVVSSREYFDQ